MSVNEDREALIEHACRVLHDAHTGRITPDSDDPTDYRAMATGLVNEGWGPRPTVSPTKLGEFIDAANAGGMAVPWRDLQDYLRESGIEVTDG